MLPAWKRLAKKGREAVPAARPMMLNGALKRSLALPAMATPPKLPLANQLMKTRSNVTRETPIIRGRLRRNHSRKTGL